MKFLASASKAAFLGAQVASRNDAHLRGQHQQPASIAPSIVTPTMVRVPTGMATGRGWDMIYDSFDEQYGLQLNNIGKVEMKEIVDAYEAGGRERSGYIIMDVREYYEVATPGKISPNTQTLPLSLIFKKKAFAMDDKEFEEKCGFPKPRPEETLVFYCLVGQRSFIAARFAAKDGGYKQLVNYRGGAYEWFSGGDS